jgi:hypothetical protein
LADPAVRSRFVAIGVEVFPREPQAPEALGALAKASANDESPRPISSKAAEPMRRQTRRVHPRKLPPLLPCCVSSRGPEAGLKFWWRIHIFAPLSNERMHPNHPFTLAFWVPALLGATFFVFGLGVSALNISLPTWTIVGIFIVGACS